MAKDAPDRKGQPVAGIFTFFDRNQPEPNSIFYVGPIVCRIMYINPGKHRVAGQQIGVLVKIPGEEGKAGIGVMLEDDSILAMDAFEAYARKKWPKPHEEGRNPKNVTLGVKGGSTKASAIFKK